MPTIRLGEILVQSGAVAAADIERAVGKSRETGRYLGEILVEDSVITDKELARILAKQLDLPLVDLAAEPPATNAMGLYPKPFAVKHCALPLRVENERVIVALADPLNLVAIEDIEFSSGYPVQRVVAPRRDILDAIERHYPVPPTPSAPLEEVAAVEEIDRIVPEDQRTVSFGIVSNKGGVGKTHIAVNSAYCMARQGRRILLIDADLGNADVSIKTGFVPKFTLLDFFNRDKGIEEIVAKSPYGFDVVAGVSGDFKLANLNHTQKLRFVRNFAQISREYDVVLFDLGAGIQRNNLDFALSTDEVIVVTTPQAIVSGYACVKASYYRFKQLERGLVNTQGLYSLGRVFKPKLIANQVFDVEGGEKIYHKIRQTLETFCARESDEFSVDLEYMGPVLYDKKHMMIVESRRSPFAKEFPNRKTSECFHYIARMMLRPPDKRIADVKFKNRLRRFLSVFARRD